MPEDKPDRIQDPVCRPRLKLISSHERQWTQPNFQSLGQTGDIFFPVPFSSSLPPEEITIEALSSFIETVALWREQDFLSGSTMALHNWSARGVTVLPRCQATTLDLP